MAQRTLARYLIEEQRNKGVITGDLKFLIEVVSRACQAISIAIGKGGLGGVLGEAGSDNVQGEAQKKLDVLSNEILLDANEWGGHLAAMASEEMDLPFTHSPPLPQGRIPAAVRPARRLLQHRRQRLHRHHLLGPEAALKAPTCRPRNPPKQAFLQPGTQPRSPPAMPSMARRPCWC